MPLGNRYEELYRYGKLYEIRVRFFDPLTSYIGTCAKRIVARVVASSVHIFYFVSIRIAISLNKQRVEEL